MEVSMKDPKPRSTPAPLTPRRSLRGNLLAEVCPSRTVLQHVTSRWGLLILMVLAGGTHRFAELRRRIGGVSERMLAQTLQWLEGDGLVLRVALDVVPPHVEYSLTPMGVEVARQVEGLADWIEGNLHRILDERRARERPRGGAASERVLGVEAPAVVEQG